jgi:hypothetical protein
MRLSITTVVVIALLAGACGAPAGRAPVAEVSGRVVAGAVCPVETDPPDPNCAPRPVAGAQLRFETGAGDGVVATTDADGVFRIEIPVGTVLVTPEPVEGLMGTPEPFEVTLTETGLDMEPIEYDTGIR